MVKKMKILVSILAVLMLMGMMTMAVAAGELSGASLKLVAFSSEQGQTGGTSGYLAAHAVDGDVATFWSNTYDPSYAGPPHYLTIDLGSTVYVTGFTYLPRQDGWTGVANGSIGPYKFLGSTDGTNFTEISGGSFNADSADKQEATFEKGASVRYVKIVSEAQEWIAIAELSVKTGEAPPAGLSTTWIIVIIAAVVIVVVVILLVALRKKPVAK